VHEWRKFLFRDPGLPAELLPGHWPGRQAAELFEAESARLLPAAARFVDCCLRPGGGSR
jgi:phenylacetic acid degradation operon negative regulatory protein